MISKLIYKNGYYILVANITNDSFESDIRKELSSIYPVFGNYSDLHNE